ncbi:MAG TPA: hypothetical protein VGM59_06645 [Dongiaceae bacterium]|jgi:hypothetical protein
MAAVAIVIVAGGIYWYHHAKADFTNPAFASSFNQSFRESFYNSCIDGSQKAFDAKGLTLTDDQREKLKQICGCAADGVAKEATKYDGMTMPDMIAAIKSDPKVKEISRSCAVQNGVAVPG